MFRNLTILVFYAKIVHSTYNANNNIFELNILATTLGNDDKTDNDKRTSSELCTNFPPFRLRFSDDSGNAHLKRTSSQESLRNKRAIQIRGRANSNVSMLSLKYINEIVLEDHAPFNASFKVLKSSVLICLTFTFTWISDILHLILDHNNILCQVEAIVFLLMFIANSICYKF